MVDPSVDGDWAGLRRVFAAAGVSPRVVHGDYLAACDLIVAGEVVSPCQPTSRGRPGMAIRPLVGNPLTVRLLVATRDEGSPGTDLDAVFTDLADSYREVAWASTAYRRWLLRNDSPLLRDAA